VRLPTGVDRRRIARWWAARERLGASDCERIRSGAVAQPANAVSSLAYVAAGAWVTRRSRVARPDLDPGTTGRAAAALVATGVGSVLYHGPCPPGARWAHDASLAALLVGVLVHDLDDLVDPAVPPGRAHGLAAVALGGLLAARPQGANAVAAGVGTAAVGAEALLARRGRRPRWRAAASLLAAGALVNVASRTGAPGCRPDSWWQGHAGWHALTAAAFAVWAVDAGGAGRAAPIRPAAPPVAS
jgi:hypothetical protein